MARHDTVEMMARHLVAAILRNPCWQDRLDDLCGSLRDDATRAQPRQTMMAVAARAEVILRHIAQSDYIAIGRLYFDLLPDTDHPLTAAVIEALSQPEAAIQLLKDAGLEPTVRKDQTGTSFLEIDVPSSSHDLCAITRTAITAAMTTIGEEPMGSLRTIH